MPPRRYLVPLSASRSSLATRPPTYQTLRPQTISRCVAPALRARAPGGPAPRTNPGSAGQGRRRICCARPSLRRPPVLRHVTVLVQIHVDEHAVLRKASGQLGVGTALLWKRSGEFRHQLGQLPLQLFLPLREFSAAPEDGIVRARIAMRGPFRNCSSSSPAADANPNTGPADRGDDSSPRLPEAIELHRDIRYCFCAVDRESGSSRARSGGLVCEGALASGSAVVACQR